MPEDHSYVRNKLLEKYAATQEGTWDIFGEDANCDWGGSHFNPKIATVQGTYLQAVEFALQSKLFFTWGSGGYITKVDIIVL